MLPIKSAAFITAAMLLAACSGDKPGGAAGGSTIDATWSPEKLTTVKGVPATEIESALRKRLASSAPTQIDDDQWGHTKRLYKLYKDNPLWLATDGLHEKRTMALSNSILQAEQDGMRMDAYPVAALAQAIAGIQQTKTPTADQLAEADIILTAAYTALGEDYLTGQVDPKSVAQSWHIDPQEENVDSALARSLRNTALDKSIAAMRPQDPGYAALRKELDRFQRIVMKGGWPAVPGDESVKPGEPMTVARATALRQRLTVEGIAAPTAGPPTTTPASPKNRAAATATYDRGLAGAVGQFQARHGIVVDSVLGGETLESLNRPAAYRAAQIAANLERLRWLPRTLGSRYVEVNVSAFRLTAYQNGEKAIEMKVIVGEDFKGRATPVFSDSMETVVFRPYWNVPPGIAAKEVFPKMSSDPGYLAANDMELYREGGATRVRQRPGDKNSLGLVKFLFPNDFNIYLHDTPNDDLFDKDVRAFSHGCIRLEKPAEFAQWVLGWDATRVQQMMNGGSDNQATKVSPKLPVYITYGTTYIRDGQLFFGNDLYDRDDKLVAEFLRGAFPKPETVQAVQALRRIASRG